MGLTLSRELKTELDELDCPKQYPVELTKDRQELARKIGLNTETNYNIGFVGCAGAGKSALINSVRGLRYHESDPEYARVGEVECTTEICGYVHPEFKSIVLWDFPGGGTMLHTASKYFKRNYLDAFDFLIIAISNDPRELDMQIAKECINVGVPFAFVRTKIDQIIDSRRRRTKESFDVAKGAIKETLEQEITKKFEMEGLVPNVYFVSQRGLDMQDDMFRDYMLDELHLLKLVLTISKGRRLAYTRSQQRRY